MSETKRTMAMQLVFLLSQIPLLSPVISLGTASALMLHIPPTYPSLHTQAPVILKCFKFYVMREQGISIYYLL